MTQISGKKYQIKNAAGTENRFPYTVMEAVLGLNSYLQDQFSALADIYMPIEGITETKTGQEFVYRKSTATIKAKSLTLDRIKGKTLAWNQIFRFTSFPGAYANYCSYDTATNTFIITNAQRSYFETSSDPEQNIISGHKYYLAANVIESTSGLTVFIKAGASEGIRLDTGSGVTSPRTYRKVHTATVSGAVGLTCWVTSGGSIKFQLYLTDLTLLYGSEIDGLTDEQILAKFESEFPGYHDFGNKLISNDAESIETVGFNKWDEEWEVGALNEYGVVMTNGYTTRRTTSFISVVPNTTYYQCCPSTAGSGRVVYYDENKKVVSQNIDRGLAANSTFVTPENAYYVRVTFGDSYGTTYNHDICINLSDPSKNGTYEPYRKTTLQLGLNNIKVKSHNIWDEEWTTGNGTNGDIDYSTPYHLVSKNFIPVIPGRTYYFKSAISNLGLYGYDANKEKISTSSLAAPQNTTFTIPDNVYFIKFQRGGSDLTYNHDICINVSSSFNGQYEPHGDITITGGLKGDGDWADILYSNNHLTNKAKRVNLGDLEWTYTSGANSRMVADITGIKVVPNTTVGNLICSKYVTDTVEHVYAHSADRIIGVHNTAQSIWVNDSAYTDAATFKAAMDGVYLDYELATPIEYELVEPLVYSMAAGTTEARVSPNTDGLSAPFCCDMTYDANANNDSANAQYALTAGRLYNTHKIWGQDFDGSADVSGAMTGVDSINGLVTFGSNRMVEIGSQNSGGTARVYGLLSANSLSSAGNVNVGGNITTSGSNAQHSFDGTTTIKDLSVTSAAYFGKSNSPVDVYVRGQFTVGSASVNKPTMLNGTLNATGNTTIGGTFTVGTSSVNKATTLYGALTASGAVSFTSTLGVTGLSTLAGGIKLTTTKKIWFGDSYYLELTSSGLHTNAGFYSDSFITAGGVGSGSGGGGNLVKERAYDISLTQITSSDYAELIHSPYISDSESGFMFAYSPAFLDTASQMHDYVIDAIGHEIGSCDIQWIGIAIGSTYTDVGVFDSGAFLVLAKSSNTYYWYEFEV